MIPTDKLLASDEVQFLQRVQHAFDALEAGPVKTLITAALCKRMLAAVPSELQKKLLASLQGQRHQPATSQLECLQCGAEAHAACNCGADYVPVGARASAAIAKSPGKSNRVIADELDVHERSVRRARNKSGAAHAAPGNAAVIEKRVGKPK